MKPRSADNLAQPHAAKPVFGAAIVLLILVLVLLGVVVARSVRNGPSVYPEWYSADPNRTPTFAGDSNSLEHTVVIPTLDTAAPEGKNVVWCSSFQLAWNEIRDNVVGGPVRVAGAEEVAARLNDAKPSGHDLDPRSYYAAAGHVRDGIIGRIRKDMAARFPSHALPELGGANGTIGIVAYSYLVANVPFKFPFQQLDRGLAFTDSEGAKTQVSGFGLTQGFLPQYKDVREQIEVIYARPDPDRPRRLKGYALDLCRHSRPYQVVVAVVEPNETLDEAFVHIEHQKEEFQRLPYYREARWFRDIDVLIVPEMFWRIDHRFTELIGRTVTNVAMPVQEAVQSIEFRLDRSGAMVESESQVGVLAIPRVFAFDRPFLVYMKKRGAKQPFFVMWVDNAELLVGK